MKKKVTIIIGEEYQASRVTLQWPEYKLLPSKYIPLVAKHIAETDNPVIRTCTDEIPNFVGAAVEFCGIEAEIIMDGVTYQYDNKGCIENWPFGVLGWWDDDDFKTIGKV